MSETPDPQPRASMEVFGQIVVPMRTPDCPRCGPDAGKVVEIRFRGDSGGPYTVRCHGCGDLLNSAVARPATPS